MAQTTHVTCCEARCEAGSGCCSCASSAVTPSTTAPPSVAAVAAGAGSATGPAAPAAPAAPSTSNSSPPGPQTSVRDGMPRSASFKFSSKRTALGTSYQMRAVDADGYRLRGGCVCFNDIDQVLLVSACNVKKLGEWKLPGGGVDPGENGLIAGLRETEEEAGVRGRVLADLGVFQNEDNMTRTAMYALRVTEQLDLWEEGSQGRRRTWLSIREAHVALVGRPQQQAMLLAAVEALCARTPTSTRLRDALRDMSGCAKVCEALPPTSESPEHSYVGAAKHCDGEESDSSDSSSDLDASGDLSGHRSDRVMDLDREAEDMEVPHLAHLSSR